MSEALDVVLVAAGRYHDIDFARLELLKLLAEEPRARVMVCSDYRDLDAIARSRALVSYTCDLRPSEEEQRALAAWVQKGGRWLALHGSNAALDFTTEGVAAPRVIDRLCHTLGSRFVAHPPIQPYPVHNAAPGHPLVAGIEDFEAEDELYLSEYPEPEALVPLLDTHWAGEATGFAVSDWSGADRHLVMYLRPLGEGAVLYNTLGHCRGHWDMRPVADYYPRIERGAWQLPVFYELLRRGLRWCLDGG